MRLIVLPFFFFITFSFAQRVSKVDFDLIKAETENPESEYSYPKLLKRYLEADSTLTINDYAFIYYGNVFTKNYNPYGLSDDDGKVMELYKKKKYKRAVSYGEKILKENPVNLRITFKMMVCYHLLDELGKAKNYARRYFPILECIYKSGNGISAETAYVVVMVADEYEILADLELSMSEQNLMGNTDVLTVNIIGNEVEEENESVKNLYFNVSKPLNYLAEQFK